MNGLLVVAAIVAVLVVLCVVAWAFNVIVLDTRWRPK